MVKSTKKYKTLKIPPPILDCINIAKAKILMSINTFTNLPVDVLSPKKCPICGHELEPFEYDTGRTDLLGYVFCRNCRYKQPVVSDTDKLEISKISKYLSVGTLIGFGIASLLFLMKEEISGKKDFVEG